MQMVTIRYRQSADPRAPRRLLIITSFRYPVDEVSQSPKGHACDQVTKADSDINPLPIPVTYNVILAAIQLNSITKTSDLTLSFSHSPLKPLHPSG